jgi:hypothetical protein
MTMAPKTQMNPETIRQLRVIINGIRNPASYPTTKLRFTVEHHIALVDGRRFWTTSTKPGTRK